MAEHDDDAPVVNVAALRRDIYRLVVLLLADEKVAEVAAFRDLADSESNHESEVSRLLIWVSIACRQLLNIKEHHTETTTCGRFCRDYPRVAWGNLTFVAACSSVIHAVELLPFDLPEDDDRAPARRRYTGTITIRGRGRRNRLGTRAVVDFPRFAECCVSLSDDYLRFERDANK